MNQYITIRRSLIESMNSMSRLIHMKLKLFINFSILTVLLIPANAFAFSVVTTRLPFEAEPCLSITGKVSLSENGRYVTYGPRFFDGFGTYNPFGADGPCDAEDNGYAPPVWTPEHLYVTDTNDFSIDRPTLSSNPAVGGIDASVSNDGRFVAYVGTLETQVPASPIYQIYLRDNNSNSNTPISPPQLVNPMGPHWVENENRVLFFAQEPGETESTGVYSYDVDSLSLTRLTVTVPAAINRTPSNVASWGFDITADGRYLVFLKNDQNDVRRVWRLSLEDAELTEVTGFSHNKRTPIVSNDGQLVVYNSHHSSVLVDLRTQQSTRLPISNGNGVRISGNGRYIAYQAESYLALANDPDPYSYGESLVVYDRFTEEVNVAVRFLCTYARYGSCYARRLVTDMSDDGSTIAYSWDYTTAWIAKISYQSETPRYTDVPTDHWASDAIESFASTGIAGSCTQDGQQFCLNRPLRRDVMAQWLERSRRGPGYPVPEASGSIFTDVSENYWAANWIELIHADGIDLGCGNSRYCPTQTMSRAQLAYFLVRALHGPSFQPRPASGIFDDASSGHWASAHIEQLQRDGIITNGCYGDPSRFCPDIKVSRATTATWLVRAFGM